MHKTYSKKREDLRDAFFIIPVTFFLFLASPLIMLSLLVSLFGGASEQELWTGKRN